ncbi:MAG: ABC transporter permease [Bacteroidetes bacterium]|nr:ABC transporter permease [Bacteroidota bacterium]MCW5895007.1 ABC transporter permease [Bacteroidota bacterium]
MSKHLLDWTSLRESMLMAVAAIKANKLRSILTLLGIVVGIFSIISVMTAMGVLRNSIEEGMMQLGANTFQLQKFPPGGPGGGHGQRWRFRNRKNITYEQAMQIREKATLAEAVGIEAWEFGRVVFWGGQKTNPNVSIAGENVEGLITNDWVVGNGRGITNQDIDLNRRVVVLGKPVADKLFPPNLNPIGESIRFDGSVYQVIGVLSSKGGALGGNQDNLAIIPITTFFQKYGKDKDIHVMVKALSRDVVDDAIEQSRMILRAARGVAPGDEDDFGYFSNDSIVKQFNDFTLYFRLGVLVISSIALLAAGVGIMNIMLVSVTERTREIGIRKAIGAQKKDILSQFIIEAVVLCQIGGIIGVFVGILAGNGISVWLETPPYMPWDWTAIGLGVCSLVGILFGVYPAWKASTLDPIEALRYE